MPSIEERVATLEKEQEASKRIKYIFRTFSVVLVTGMLSALAMLITTNQTAGTNEARIQRIDDRQREMQTNIGRLQLGQERLQTGQDDQTALLRTLIERSPR